MSKLGEMMTDPAFEKFALSLGEDLANKRFIPLVHFKNVCLKELFSY